MRNTSLRNAKLEPRSTIPSATSVNGTNRVIMIDENAGGKAVHRTTSVKMTHTWFTSHTGAMEASITARGRSPRRAPPATRSQKPAPKSAPPNSA